MIKTEDTYWVKLYLSGPIEIAKQAIRAECLRKGLCVTIEPTTFIYSGGEEAGYVVGLVNYPRFPSPPDELVDRAEGLAVRLLDTTHQYSALLQTPLFTRWISRRPQE